MELTLELKQTQKLSPQGIQSMQILQMGTHELQGYVEKELMENPTLELEHEFPHNERSELLHKMDWLMSNDRQNRWYHQEDSRSLVDYLAVSDEENLHDHLQEQLKMEALPARLRIAVDCILSSLNRNGYLDESPEELSARCGQPLPIIKHAEELVRSLEPAGIGARTLSECLALQLERSGDVGLPLIIVKNYLDELAKNHYSQIAKKGNASREEVQNACNLIRSLDPRPGSQFAPREAPGYIIPDVLITEEDGQLAVTSGDHFLPVLKVNHYYQSLKRTTDDQEVKEYLEDRVRQATMLIKSIEQRRNTLLTCAQVIAGVQEAFFRSSEGDLLPLTLADVAKEMGVHESTVSRTIKSKYLQCKRGTFPLNYFFSRSLQTKDGDISSSSVKNQIQSLIEQEDRKRPLSDQKICGILAAQNINLSRRTVAKYRDELGIPPTTARKEF